MNKKEHRERWKKFLSCKRLSELVKGSIKKDCDLNDPRNPFQRDCDRITYSYPFRRMQSKTQVIPRPEIDFIHTRLTHSLEVATVGRSLGKLLEYHLLKELMVLDKNELGSIPAILAAACLSHDIGNPAFGHSGEDSISQFFRFNKGWSYLEKEYLPEDFIPEEPGLTNIYFIKDSKSIVKCCDLIKFEGNAMGFRILTKYNKRGLDLTSAVLGSFIKYPRQSYILGDDLFDKDKRWQQGVSQKKYSFFYDDREAFELVANELGLQRLSSKNGLEYAWHRHPLAFLMEAADDICYTIIDLEDGFRMGLIPFKEIKNKLKSIASKDNSVGRYNEADYRRIKDEKEKFSYLRAKAINYLIHSVFNCYKTNLNEIISGEFDDDLISKIEVSGVLKEIKEKIVRKYVYQYREVLEIEAAGFEIFNKLLTHFVAASDYCKACENHSTNNKESGKFSELLPQEYKSRVADPDPYYRLLDVACYVAGMSDSYALDMYRKITGISMR